MASVGLVMISLSVWSRWNSCSKQGMCIYSDGHRGKEFPPPWSDPSFSQEFYIFVIFLVMIPKKKGKYCVN